MNPRPDRLEGRARKEAEKLWICSGQEHGIFMEIACKSICAIAQSEVRRFARRADTHRKNLDDVITRQSRKIIAEREAAKGLVEALAWVREFTKQYSHDGLLKSPMYDIFVTVDGPLSAYKSQHPPEAEGAK